MKQYGTRNVQFMHPEHFSVPAYIWLYLRHHMVNPFYRLFCHCFHPPLKDKQYEVSLCAMYRDEAPYLKEWIEFHLLVGVSHFFMYDNLSSDNHEEILRPYIDQGIVTLIRWPHEHAQVRGYEDCMDKYGETSAWIGFVDVDEFVVPLTDNSLPDFLAGFKNRPAVRINWKLFNTAGLLTRNRTRLVTEDFVVASAKPVNRGKCFWNTAWKYLKNNPRNITMFHVFWTTRFGFPVPPSDVFGDVASRSLRKKDLPIQINHYTLKSKEEYMEKDLKGDVFFEKPTHDERSFYYREYRCNAPDFTAYKYLTALKERMS